MTLTHIDFTLPLMRDYRREDRNLLFGLKTNGANSLIGILTPDVRGLLNLAEAPPKRYYLAASWHSG